MEDISLWILIFAGGAIGLLGVFLAASERELKKTRREVEGLAVQLENSPRIVTLDNPAESQPVDSVAVVGASAKDPELYDKIAYLTSELETARRSAEELRSPTESHINTALDDGQNAANDRIQLEAVIADLQNQVEMYRVQIGELEVARQQLADFESREAIHKNEQKNAQAQIAVLRQEFLAAKEQVRELHATRERMAELERLHQNTKHEIRHLEEERSHWQERLANGDDQRRRGAMLREQLDELLSKQAALIEGHRQFQNDLAAAVRLTEVRPDGISDASVAPAPVTENEACSFPTLMAKANIDAPSNGMGGNHEIHTDSSSSAVSTDMSPMIPAIDPSSTMMAGRRRRRFRNFWA